MLDTKIRSLITQGEGLKTEFKECHNELSKNVFETICAFLKSGIRLAGILLFGKESTILCIQVYFALESKSYRASYEFDTKSALRKNITTESGKKALKGWWQFATILSI